MLAGNDAIDDDAFNREAEENNQPQADSGNEDMREKGDKPGAVGYKRNEYPGRPKPVSVPMDRTMLAENDENDDDVLTHQVEENDQTQPDSRNEETRKKVERPGAVGYRRNEYPGRPKPVSVPVDRTMLAWNYGNDDDALTDHSEENKQIQPKCSRDEIMHEKGDGAGAVGYRRNEYSDQVITDEERSGGYERSGGKLENRGLNPEQNRSGHASGYRGRRGRHGRGGKPGTVGCRKNEQPGRMKTGNVSKPSSYDATSSDEEDDRTIQHPDFEFFWKKGSPFSQWYQRKFSAGEQQFITAEQFIMYQKAVIFQDYETAEKILKERNPSKQQKLGMQARNFDPQKWKEVCLTIVKTANHKKFSQNEDLKNHLFSTYPKILVEASPYDKIWGIGRDASDPKAQTKETWLGHNLLGYALTDIRNKMMIKEGIIPMDAQTFLAESALIDVKICDEVERFV